MRAVFCAFVNREKPSVCTRMYFFFFSPHLSSLSTFTLSLGLCGDLLPQLDCSPPFSPDRPPPQSVTPPLLLYSHLNCKPFQLPFNQGRRLKSLPSLCLSKGFLLSAHTCSILASSLIVLRRGCAVTVDCWTTVGMQMLCVCMFVSVCSILGLSASSVSVVCYTSH